MKKDNVIMTNNNTYFSVILNWMLKKRIWFMVVLVKTNVT